MKHTMIRILLVPALSLQLAGAAAFGVDFSVGSADYAILMLPRLSLEGYAAYKRGDYAVAFEEFSAAAEQGDACGQLGLGIMYAWGYGVPQNYAAAMKWWRKAAEQGDVGAQSLLGHMYAEGKAVPQDYAAEGDAEAQYHLGRMYYKGKGVPQDYAAAMKWWRKAAEQGHADAQNGLGVMYNNGKGVPQDYIQAHMWYNLAATNGFKAAIKSRDNVAQKMTPSQVAKAQRLAHEWRPAVSP